LRKLSQWLWNLVLLRHQHGLQVHQTQVVSPRSSCKLDALLRPPVCYPSHLPVAPVGSPDSVWVQAAYKPHQSLQRPFWERPRIALSTVSHTILWRQLSPAVKQWLSRPNLNAGKTAFDTCKAQATFQQVESTTCSWFWPQAHTKHSAEAGTGPESGLCATLREVSAVPWVERQLWG